MGKNREVFRVGGVKCSKQNSGKCKRNNAHLQPLRRVKSREYHEPETAIQIPGLSGGKTGEEVLKRAVVKKRRVHLKKACSSCAC